MLEHSPWPTTFHQYEDVGGVKIELGTVTRIQCGCREDLLYEFDDGHAEIEHLEFDVEETP